MGISFNRYINITSGLGAGATVDTRDLIARLITTNDNLPTGAVQEFTNAADVTNFFGADTDESRRALFYFGFVSKSITRPNRISYARWAEVDTAPMALGLPVTATLAQLQAITAGAFLLTLGSASENVPGIDLSTATDFATIASLLQTAIRAVIAGGVPFTGAIVTYDAVRNRFELTGGGTGAAVITIEDNSTTEALGWGTGVTLSDGVAAQTVTEVLTDSTTTSNNFGSFAFVPTLTQQQVVEAATWNDGNNLLFMYLIPVLRADAAAYSADIINLAGNGLTERSASAANEYPEMLPMATLAATDYTRRAATSNYMFVQASLTPTVFNATDADLLDGLRVNYYGQTQTAGQNLAFYQRGFLTGTGTDPINMNIFANEQWLKDFAGSRLMALLLAAPRVPASAAGRGQVLAVLRDVVDTALINGTISVGRTLSAQQRVFIGEQTGDPNAFQQVQTSGFWLDAVVVQDGVEFRINYTLVYSTDQVVRRVDGIHSLV